MNDRDASAVKTCPQCGQMLFADMRVCYGCLHDFEREGEPAVGQAFAGATSRGASPRIGADVDRHLDDTDSAAADEPAGVDHGSAHATAMKQTDASVDAVHAQKTHENVPPNAHGQVSAMKDGVRDRYPIRDHPSPSASGSLEPEPAESVALRIQTTTLDVVLPLPASGLSIGRSPDNDVVLHSPLVSERHLRLEPSGKGASALDLGATNPARLRGHRVLDERFLTAGDVLDVCGTVMTLIRT